MGGNHSFHILHRKNIIKFPIKYFYFLFSPNSATLSLLFLLLRTAPKKHPKLCGAVQLLPQVAYPILQNNSLLVTKTMGRDHIFSQGSPSILHSLCKWLIKASKSFLTRASGCLSQYNM